MFEADYTSFYQIGTYFSYKPFVISALKKKFVRIMETIVDPFLIENNTIPEDFLELQIMNDIKKLGSSRLC